MRISNRLPVERLACELHFGLQFELRTAVYMAVTIFFGIPSLEFSYSPGHLLSALISFNLSILVDSSSSLVW